MLAIVAQNVPARTFELRCRDFPDFHLLCCIFLVVFEILGQPNRCFWSFESSFLTVLTIVIRRLLHVPDYVVGSLNSSYIWTLSLHLAEYNFQHYHTRMFLRLNNYAN